MHTQRTYQTEQKIDLYAGYCPDYDPVLPDHITVFADPKIDLSFCIPLRDLDKRRQELGYGNLP